MLSQIIFCGLVDCSLFICTRHVGDERERKAAIPDVVGHFPSDQISHSRQILQTKFFRQFKNWLLNLSLVFTVKERERDCLKCRTLPQGSAVLILGTSWLHLVHLDHQINSCIGDERESCFYRCGFHCGTLNTCTAISSPPAREWPHNKLCIHPFKEGCIKVCDIYNNYCTCKILQVQ